jgi:hypothetical protein
LASSLIYFLTKQGSWPKLAGAESADLVAESDADLVAKSR